MSNDLGIAVQARLALVHLAAQAVQYLWINSNTRSVYRYLYACIRSLAVEFQHSWLVLIYTPRPRQ